MVALFRIEDLKQGQILIDGIDIARVSLNLLRNKLCIIPQDPVMFSASVRFNLDPFDEHSDEEVWEVLTSVNMREHVLSLPNKLQEMVAEGGDNFSAGQRQVSFTQLQRLGVAVRQSRMGCAHCAALARVRLSYMS
jgi:ABC-type multidrug transport system fused ATPase/permease subunit